MAGHETTANLIGNGIHFCLGAALGRTEGELAITHLVRRFPDLRLATDRPEFAPRIVLRGLASLPVRLTRLPGTGAA